MLTPAELPFYTLSSGTSMATPHVSGVIALMLEMLATAGVRSVHLDLGHVGLYRALARQSGLTEGEERRLFEVLQRKDTSEMAALLAESTISEPYRMAFRALLDLHGPLDCVAVAREALAAGGGAGGRGRQELVGWWACVDARG